MRLNLSGALQTPFGRDELDRIVYDIESGAIPFLVPDSDESGGDEEGRSLLSRFLTRLCDSPLLQGALSALDLAPSLDPLPPPGLSRDWDAVFGDFSRAITAAQQPKDTAR
jgi:hypothetical protein